MNNSAWTADLGNGSYQNPILYTDYSDPDAIRVGDDFFMVASSFCNTPAIPILHSKDLVNWTVINYALDKIPYERYSKPAHGCGVWAPTIRYHQGTYYIFFPMPDEGIFVTKTKDPWGKWEAPTIVFEGKGWIDPCPFWDDDGKVYMVSAFAKSRMGFKSILNLCELHPDTLAVVDEGKFIFDGNVTGQHTIEGPKMYKRNGWYYIFAPAGGVKTGWQTVLRSQNIGGPYEYREVMKQGNTNINGPHQGAWVDTQNGEDWFIHFQDVYAAGRIVHLQPMSWIHDWPVIGEAAAGQSYGVPVQTCRKPNVGKTYPTYAPAASDDFSGETLGLQWQWNANYDLSWYKMNPKEKTITLHAIPKDSTVSLSDTPNLLLQKWAFPAFTADTKLDVTALSEGDTAGMVSLGVAFGAIAVTLENGKKKLLKITGRQTFDQEAASASDFSEVLMELEELDFIYFRNIVKQVPEPTICSENDDEIQDHPFEIISFSYSLDGVDFKEVSAFDAKAGRWVGVKNGLFCYHIGDGKGGSVQAEYFKIKP